MILQYNIVIWMKNERLDMIFKNRADAGKLLARKVSQYQDKNVLVLALPRGGIPVASEVSSRLNAELDIIITRKITSPENPELAIGSVASDGIILLNHSLIFELGLTKDSIDSKVEQGKHEVKEYRKKYRGNNPFPEISNRTVLIVDDGIATGYTIMAAARAVLKRNPRELVIAVPVAPRNTIYKLKKLTRCEVISVLEPSDFIAVGQFYEDFSQVSDAEIRDILMNFNL